MARALSLATAVLVALIVALPGAAPAQTKDDTIVYALQTDVDNWDPPNSVLREAIILGYHVFDHLAARDVKTGKVGPSLAVSWKAIDDTTWEVKLRPGVKFHDGTPFTSKDVKATFERVLDPAKKMSARGNHAKIKSLDAIDDLTVRFHTDGPYPLFVERLTAQSIQSAKVIQEKGHDWMQENPVGTGPYKFVKWSRKQEHLLVRNDDYWGTKPHFKYVRIRIIPEQATQIAELLSGGVDIIKAVPPDQMDVIDKSGQARIVTSPILRTAYVKLDQPARNGKNPMEDRRVRQAANLAVDMDTIIKHVLNGLGDRTATGGQPDGLRLRPRASSRTSRIIPRAKKLLADAGFPNGFDIRIDVAPPVVEPATHQTNEAIVADLAKAGIRAKQQLLRGQQRPSDSDQGGQGRPRWSTGSWGYYSSSTRTRCCYDNFKCGEAWSTYCNKEVDDLIDAGRSTLDQKKRAEIYVQAQKMLFDDAAALFKWGLRGVWGGRTGSSTTRPGTRSTACSS